MIKIQLIPHQFVIYRFHSATDVIFVHRKTPFLYHVHALDVRFGDHSGNIVKKSAAAAATVKANLSYFVVFHQFSLICFSLLPIDDESNVCLLHSIECTMYIAQCTSSAFSFYFWTNVWISTLFCWNFSSFHLVRLPSNAHIHVGDTFFSLRLNSLMRNFDDGQSNGRRQKVSKISTKWSNVYIR